jgi:hemoglobin
VAIIGDLPQPLKEIPRSVRYEAGQSLDLKSASATLTIEEICVLSCGPCLYEGCNCGTRIADSALPYPSRRQTLNTSRMCLTNKAFQEREWEEFLELFERHRKRS